MNPCIRFIKSCVAVIVVLYICNYIQAELKQQGEQSENLERFIEKIHKYFDLQELMPAILNDIVKCVHVHASKKIDEHRTQVIDIYYDLVHFLPLLNLYYGTSQSQYFRLKQHIIIHKK